MTMRGLSEATELMIDEDDVLDLKKLIRVEELSWQLEKKMQLVLQGNGLSKWKILTYEINNDKTLCILTLLKLYLITFLTSFNFHNSMFEKILYRLIYFIFIAARNLALLLLGFISTSSSVGTSTCLLIAFQDVSRNWFMVS